MVSTATYCPSSYLLFSKSIEKLVVAIESSFTKEVDLLIKEKRHIIAAQLIQRGLEACNKFEANSEDSKAIIDDFNNFRKIDDIQWTVPEWSNLAKRINSVREDLVIAFAQSLDSLVKIKPLVNIPDYFGQGILLVAKECYSSLAEGNEDKFNRLYPLFFFACLSAHDRESGQLENQDKNVSFIICNESIIDLFAISGSAILYSELDSKNYSKIVLMLWNRYYDDYAEGPDALSRYFKMVFDFSISIYSMLTLSYNHSILRLEWKQNIEQQLQDRGLLNDNHTYYSQKEDSPGSKHQSAIIRALTRKGFETDCLEDIFFALFIMKRPEAKEIDWSRSRLLDLANSFAEEEIEDLNNEGETYDENKT
jgi:hypothetical protein